jgi:hypothetical protein
MKRTWIKRGKRGGGDREKEIAEKGKVKRVTERKEKGRK